MHMRVWPRARARPQPARRIPCVDPLDLSYFFVRGQPHPTGSCMGNFTHHPPPNSKQQHRGFEPLGSARPLGPQSLRRRHLPENAGAHPAAAGSDGPGGLGQHTHDAHGPDAAARAGPCLPPNTGRLHGDLAGTRATPACHGAVRDSTHTEPTLHLHYPSMQYAYICIPTTHL